MLAARADSFGRDTPGARAGRHATARPGSAASAAREAAITGSGQVGGEPWPPRDLVGIGPTTAEATA